MDPIRGPEPFIDSTSLVDASPGDIDFLDTSFFQHYVSLPTPSEALEKRGGRRHRIIKYEHMSLIIKFNNPASLKFEEVQTMRAIKNAFPHNEIPVPEVFGWRTFKGNNFIYMSLMPSQELFDAWLSLTQLDKTRIASQLGQIVEALRSIDQGGEQRWIGSINGVVLQDRYFRIDYENGPFPSIEAFNHWVYAAATRQRPGLEGPDYSMCKQYGMNVLPNTGEIYFTHGDLTPSNIIVDGSPGSYKITGVIDWEQSGWYPEFWEYCKMHYSVEEEYGWVGDGWVGKVMKSHEYEWEIVEEYYQWRQP